MFVNKEQNKSLARLPSIVSFAKPSTLPLQPVTMAAHDRSDPVPPRNSITSLTCPVRQRGWRGDGWLARCC